MIRHVDGQKHPGDINLQRMIQYRPNMYMNGKDFLYKVRTRLELDNTVFIYIQRDMKGRCTGLYPMPPALVEAVDYNGNLYIQFQFTSGKIMVLSWEDLAVLRKDYNKSDIYGDTNTAIRTSLELLHTTNEGLGNSIKSTSNLRGILKSTKAMLDPADVKKQKDEFVRDYMNISNEGGIASLDSTQEFTPIKLEPATANYKHIEELRNNIYRYFGVNDNILMSQTKAEEWEAFYESRLEPFLIALGLELTNKVFTERERGFGNEIIFEANRLQYASTSAKMNMVQLVDRGIISINEYREVLNLAPVEDGDIRVIRKEYAKTGNIDDVIEEPKGDEDDDKQ